MSSGKKHIEIICAVLLIALLYGVFALLGIGCPIKFMTGISCMGCGMTRAWAAVLHMDIAGAFKLHPLWWSIVPAFIVFMLHGRLSKKALNILLFIFIAAFVIVYLYRMIEGDQDIVVFEPQSGLIWQIVRSIIEGLRRAIYVLQ